MVSTLNHPVSYHEKLKTVTLSFSGKSQIACLIDESIVLQWKEALLRIFPRSDSVHWISLPCGENAKTRQIKEKVEDQLLELGFARDSTLIAVGGGAISDVVGFIASTYMRGISYITLPTTLLSMVDAAIGGKTAINIPQGKNLIGSFYSPTEVHCALEFLTTLPDEEWRSGFSEMIKYALIEDQNLFLEFCELESLSQIKSSAHLLKWIKKSCTIKQRIIEEDPKENGVRRILNFGHTIGHAYEHCSNFSHSHGDCIAVGMLIESFISYVTGLLPLEELIKIREFIHRFSFPFQAFKRFSSKPLIQIMKRDKKNRDGLIQMALIEQIGSPHQASGEFRLPIETKIIEQGIEWFQKGAKI